MGFCLLNNAAVAAEAARRAGAERVLIVDWDVHHGNGTQEIFVARDDVLYMSVHQYPFYPGTGAAEEIGLGAGKGATVNCPLPGGQDDADYGAVFHDLFLPVARAFAPDLILVSAGFDAHARDPLAEMSVTERGFAAMTSAAGGARARGLRRQAGAAARGGLRPRRRWRRRCARRWRCWPAGARTSRCGAGDRAARWRWPRRATRSRRGGPDRPRDVNDDT